MTVSIWVYDMERIRNRIATVLVIYAVDFTAIILFACLLKWIEPRPRSSSGIRRSWFATRRSPRYGRSTGPHSRYSISRSGIMLVPEEAEGATAPKPAACDEKTHRVYSKRIIKGRAMMGDSKELTELAIDSVMSEGACAAGITTTDTLFGGPPSTDLTYVLPGARSAVTFAVPLDPGAIERYLSKKDHAGHQRDNIRTNLYVTGLAVGPRHLSRPAWLSILRRSRERRVPQGYARGHRRLQARHFAPLPCRSLRRRLVRALGQRHHENPWRRRDIRHCGHDRRA